MTRKRKRKKKERQLQCVLRYTQMQNSQKGQKTVKQVFPIMHLNTTGSYGTVMTLTTNMYQSVLFINRNLKQFF